MTRLPAGDRPANIAAAKLLLENLLPTAKPLCNALAEVYFTDRYAGFDLEDVDWPKLRQQIEAVAGLADAVRSRLGKHA